MNALKEGKTSGRVKNALLRNHIAENNMKTSLKSLTTGVSKKELDSLKYKQAFYQQRKKQLEASVSPASKPGNARSKTALNRSPGGRLEFRRTISDQTSFESITDLHSRPRALSSLSSSPSIEISDYDENGDSNIYTKTKLPSIPPSGNGQLTSGIPLRGRAKSSSDISRDVAVFLDKITPETRRLSSGDLTVDEYLAKRRRSSASGYMLNTPTNASAARSTPVSPVLGRKSLADTPGSQNQRNEGRKGNARKKQVSNNDVQTEQVETLAESLNKIKFCRYLRDADGEEMLNREETLPDELKPKEIVLGHTKVVF